MTIKISAIVVLAALVASIVLRRARSERRARVVVAAGGAAVLVPWLARGLLASGCLVFPVASTCVPVHWATPTPLVVETGEMIRAWAREPWAPIQDVLAGWGGSPSGWRKP